MRDEGSAVLAGPNLPAEPASLPLYQRSPLLLLLILAGLNILWAPVNLFVKLANDTGWSPTAIGAMRWTFVAIAMWVLVASPWFRRVTLFRMPTAKQCLFALLLGMLFMAPGHALYYVGLENTSSVEGTILNTLGPVFAAVLGYFILKEKVTRRRWVAIAVSIFGAYLVSVGFQLPVLSAGNTMGNATYLLGTITECFGIVLAAKLVRDSSAVGVAAWQFIGAMVGFWALAAMPGFMHFEISSWNAVATWSVLYLALIPGVFCFTTWYILVRTTPIAILAVSILLQPPVAAILGYFVLGERLLPTAWLGTALILFGLVLASLSPNFSRLKNPRTGASS
jgi:drug/metabolite transporter (DMT)-like permease